MKQRNFLGSFEMSLFKKFSPSEDVASSNKIKSSQQRAIRTKLIAQMPLLAEAGAEVEGEGQEQATVLEVIWPKKDDITLVKGYVFRIVRHDNKAKSCCVWLGEITSSC